MIIIMNLYIVLLLLLLLIKLNQHFSFSSTTNSITLALYYRNQSVHLNAFSSKSIFSEEYGLLLESVPYPYVYHVGLPFKLNSVYPVISFKIKNAEKRRSAYYFYENELWLVIVSFFYLGEINTIPWYPIYRKTMFPGNNIIWLLSREQYRRTKKNITDSSYSTVSIEWVNHTDSPFMRARNVCVNSKNEWLIYLKSGNYNVHYPDRNSNDILLYLS